MHASDLIATIRGMTREERTEFGRALAECGVSVVLIRQLGSSTQEKRSSNPTEDELNRVNDYHGKIGERVSKDV